MGLSTYILIAVALLAGVILLIVVPRATASGGMDPEEADRLRGLVKRGEAPLVDVRTVGEFSGDALEGALNLPVQEIEQRYGELGEKDTPIVLYCRSGNRSANAKRFLESQGYTRVYDLGSRGNAERVLAAPAR